MDKSNEIRISVRNLVEFVLRSGDLDTRFMGPSRALQGTKIHQKIQESSDDGYTPEVTLKYNLKYQGFNMVIEGRADGILEEDNKILIDEIKSTTRPLELIDENYNPLHWAQAKCYGYIYGKQKELQEIGIQLTYCQLDTEEIKKIRKIYTIDQLASFFYELIDKYTIWVKLITDWEIKRNASIIQLEFPFKAYRKGQRELAIGVYKTITNEKKLYVQAPTGIGKTISTLFPSIKAMGEGHTSKIFYLTAKTITRQVAEEALFIMKEKGLQFKTITLTAKDKICFKEESNCNPEYCEFAKGHFDRVNDALLDILDNENMITRDVVEKYARKHQVCPFEFSLDLAIWTDCVICDYNYVFDPRVYLRRFFMDNNGDYTFLVDEAHNLVDRSREMFSSELHKKTFLELKRVMKDKNPRIATCLNKLNSFMLKMKRKCNEDGYHIQKEEPHDIYPLLRRLIKESEGWLVENQKTDGHKELLELYFNSYAFLKIAEFYDERYVTYVVKEDKGVKIKLYCVAPSYLLREAIKRGKTAVFFSATLTPLKYFRDMLGGSDEDYLMRLSSPFDRKKLCLLIANNISTKYKDRENSYDKLADYIWTVVKKKKGNYLVFFPSYKYMNEVYKRFEEKFEEINIIIQSSEMKEEERENFLGRFKPNSKETLVGFAVLGGIFSEGVDLKGERLSGAIIVGVGLPQLCLERNIIKDYFNAEKVQGFEYAYKYPGMNKVLQGAGRVIRSEEDKGVVLLIDERFSYFNYKQLFPREWFPNITVRSTREIEYYLERFWSE